MTEITGKRQTPLVTCRICDGQGMGDICRKCLVELEADAKLGKAVNQWIISLHLYDAIPGRLRTWARDITMGDTNCIDMTDIGTLLVMIANEIEERGDA